MEEKSRIIKKLNSDSSRPVLFNESHGVSENQLNSTHYGAALMLKTYNLS